MRTVKVSRPDMPGYGLKDENEGKGLYEWSHVTERMIKSRNYWVCTTRPDGRPHAAPVWGAWVDGALYFGTGTTSVKARNIKANPAVVIHLESGDDTVILEGSLELLTNPDVSLTKKIGDAYEGKYNWRPSDFDNGGWHKLNHQVAFAWHENDFPSTATRWVFAD